jgi:two-component system sensor histidine kinase BaeS
MTAKPSPYPELFNLGQSIDSLAESLEQARGAERQFLLSISHDLRTPLTSIRGFAEALSDGTATDVGRASAIMASEAARLERLIRDLLDLARLDARTFSLDLRPVDVGEVAGATAEGLRFQLDGVGVDLVVRVPAEPLHALADADRLAQIVANLVENAFKFARSRVELSVSADAPGSVLLAVEDDGPGIPADDLPRVFERLYTANRHAARAGGTGLGLSIVAELSAAMGGEVEARSPTGSDGGTAFLVRLQRWDSDGPREPAALSSPAARVPPSTVPSA